MREFFMVGLVFYSSLAIASISIEKVDYFEAVKAIKQAPAVVLTVASDLKVHGPHLPLKTDSILATSLAAELGNLTQAAIMPNFAIGWYPQFSNFSLTQYSAETIQRITKEHLEGLIKVGAKRLFIVNFDVDRSSGLPISIVATELRQKYRIPIVVLSWHDFVDERVTQHISSFKGHADELETSLMLHLAPELVQKNKMVNVPDLEAHAFGVKGMYPIILDQPEKKSAFSVPGQMGYSKLATAEKGEKAFKAILANLVTTLESFLKAEP